MVELLGHLLQRLRMIGEQQLDDGLRAQQANGGRLGTNLVELGSLDLSTLSRALGEQHNLPVATAWELDQASSRAVMMVPRRIAEAFLVVPLALENKGMTVAMASAFDPAAVEALERTLRTPVVARLTPELLILRYLEKFYDYVPSRPVPVKSHSTREEKSAVATKTAANPHLSQLKPGEFLMSDDDEIVHHPSEPFQPLQAPASTPPAQALAANLGPRILSKWAHLAGPSSPPPIEPPTIAIEAIVVPEPLVAEPVDDLPVLSGELPTLDDDAWAEAPPQVAAPVPAPPKPLLSFKPVLRQSTLEFDPTAPSPAPRKPAPIARQSTLEFDLLAAMPAPKPREPEPAEDWEIDAGGEKTQGEDWSIESDDKSNK